MTLNHQIPWSKWQKISLTAKFWCKLTFANFFKNFNVRLPAHCVSFRILTFLSTSNFTAGLGCSFCLFFFQGWIRFQFPKFLQEISSSRPLVQNGGFVELFSRNFLFTRRPSWSWVSLLCCRISEPKIIFLSLIAVLIWQEGRQMSHLWKKKFVAHLFHFEWKKSLGPRFFFVGRKDGGKSLSFLLDDFLVKRIVARHLGAHLHKRNSKEPKNMCILERCKLRAIGSNNFPTLQTNKVMCYENVEGHKTFCAKNLPRKCLFSGRNSF